MHWLLSDTSVGMASVIAQVLPSSRQWKILMVRRYETGVAIAALAALRISIHLVAQLPSKAAV